MSDPQTAFVPECEWDVFISYSWANNSPQSQNDPASGWVHRFRERLRDRLNEKLRRHGGRVRVFFDTYAVRRQMDFRTQVAEAVSSSAVMVALISDAWIGSEHCWGEIASFNDQLGGAAKQTGRLFPVHLEKTLDWPSELSVVLDGVRGYDFYSTDEVEQISRRYPIESEEFQRELDLLRVRIAEQLTALYKGIGAAPAEVANPAATVYLAEAVGMKRVRDHLESHLRSARIRVLPEQPYPRDPGSFRDALRTDLEAASFFVQVFGSACSTRSAELPRGYEGLQLEVATQLDKPVLQWRDPRLNLDDLDEPNHADMARQAEYFGPLIEFAQAVRERVDRLVRAELPRDAAGARRHWALVKAEPSDRLLAGSLVDHLAGEDIGCRLTPNGLRTLEWLREHEFDAVIMVCGSCPEEWIQRQADELVAVLQDRKEQAPICGFYLDRPRTPPLVVKGIHQVVCENQGQLGHLVSAILQRGGDL